MAKTQELPENIKLAKMKNLHIVFSCLQKNKTHK